MLASMSISGGRLWVMVCLAVTWTSGCAYGEMRQVLRTHLAGEMNCPEMQVEYRAPAYMRAASIRPEWADQYLAEGCGVTRVYTCPPNSSTTSYDSAWRCTYEEGNPDAPERASMEPETP